MITRLAFLAILGTMCLIRTEAVPIAIAFGAWGVLSRRVAWWQVIVAVALPVLATLIASKAAFGDWLPNTYYLKTTGYPLALRLTRGLWVTCSDLLRVAPLFALALLTKNRWRWPVLAALATAVWLGGDAWHSDMTASRYVLSVLPLLLVYGAFLAVEWLPRRALWPAVIASLFVFSPPARLLTTELPNHYRERAYAIAVKQGLWAREKLRPEVSLGVVAAGIIPYISRKVSLDILGKSDRVIARMTMHRAEKGKSPLTFFNPGHLKYDPLYTAGVQKPRVVLQVWGDRAEWLAAMDSFRYALRVASFDGDTWPMYVR